MHRPYKLRSQDEDTESGHRLFTNGLELIRRQSKFLSDLISKSYHYDEVANAEPKTYRENRLIRVARSKRKAAKMVVGTWEVISLMLS